MEQKGRGCLNQRVIVAVLVAALALVVLCGLIFLYVTRQQQIYAQFDAPVVVITKPDCGSSVPVEGHVTVGATVLGANPVTRADLWVDGEWVDTQNSEQPGGTVPFYAYFDWVVPEGPHLLFVRATSSAGVTGQSLPVSIVGEPPSELTQRFTAFTVREGQTLEDIAGSYVTEPVTLRHLNPVLNGQQPAAGAQVVVPARPTVALPEEAAILVASGVTSPPVWAGTAISPPVPTPSAAGEVTLLPPSASPGSSSLPLPGAPPLAVITPAPLPIGAGLLVGVATFKPPEAPSNLQAQVSQCKIRLLWNDNASDELRYAVWLAGQGYPARLVASVQPAVSSPASFEFAGPRPGSFNVWVEAVNSVGSQPSNIAVVQIPSTCPNTLPSQLQVHLLDVKSRAKPDNMYCYVSLEGAPEARVPAEKSTFIRLEDGQGKILAQATGRNKFRVPSPEDSVLDITGECWGWSGETLDKLGNFSGSIGMEQWTGTKLELQGEGFEIGLAVQQVGEGGELSTYDAEDPTLPSPYDLKITSIEYLLPWLPRIDILSWSWTASKPVDAFVVYLDGKPYKMISDASTQALHVQMPSCGTKYHWQVAAVAGTDYSRPSAEYVYTTDECPVYVDVEFTQLDVACVHNYAFHKACPRCEEVDTWFDIWVNGEWAGSGSEQFLMVISCGSYPMSQLYYWGDPKWAKVRKSLSSTNNSIKILSDFYYVNCFGELRHFQRVNKTITMPLQQWKTYKAELKLSGWGDGVVSSLTVKIEAVETVSTL